MKIYIDHLGDSFRFKLMFIILALNKSTVLNRPTLHGLSSVKSFRLVNM